MFIRRRSFLLTLALVAALRLVAGPRAAEPSCEFDNVERIVAVGDVHGAYDRFFEILRAAELVDARGKWIGGKAHLVQVGDVLDRGPDSRKALDYLRGLQREASAAGGRVHELLGNHEAARMLGDYRYTTDAEYAAFATRDSEELRQRFIESRPADQREALLKETLPLGKLELISAFGPKGPYGSYLLTLNAVVRINGVLFLHGGISPAIAAMNCDEINKTVRRELSTDLEKTRVEALKSLTAREDGPLWYRGLAQEPDSFEPEVDKILAAQQARAIVVAHTVQPSGRILVRFGGKVIGIDTGMQSQYIATGKPSALEIRGPVFTAIYLDGREVIAK